MQCNIGKTDRTLRMLVGIALLVFAAATQNPLGLIGVVPLLTGAIRWCPLYVPLKLSTIRKR